MIDSVANDMRERIPLHASATCRGIAGRLMTLPSRRTGTPMSCSSVLASLDASNCRGNVIWLNTIAGMGTMRNRKAQGNNTAQKKHDEARNQQDQRNPG